MEGTPLARRLLATALVALIAATPSMLAQRSLAEISKNGIKAEGDLKFKPAQWDVRARTGTGAQFGLRIVSSPPDFEARILLRPETKNPEPFARVISKSGKWYVEEYGGLKGIYLPWQAPFSFEVVALLLSECWPSGYVLEDGHRYGETRNQVTTVRAPLKAGQRAMAEAFLQEAAASGVVPAGELKRNLGAIKQRLKEGNVLKVDARTGLLRGLSLGNVEIVYGRVEWLSKKPEISLLAHLPDFSAPFPKDRENLIMIGRAGAWRPGLPNMDAGGHLLNLENGKLLRIPFVGSSCMPGCFVAERSKVAVTARETSGAGVGLYLIHLDSGKSERLGGKSFATGQCQGPVLSPDGKSLAVTHSHSILMRQLYLLDLAGGKPRAIGRPRDASGFSWIGDGSGLIGITRQRRTGVPEGVPEYRMTRFGLDGSVRNLREDVGNFALVVGEKGDRILFQEKGNSWHTCDLNGGDVKMLGKGLSGLDFPSASPDGKRVIMIEHDEKERTCPVVVDLATGEVKKAKAEEGRWVLPVWR
jgi:hypothetical protein